MEHTNLQSSWHSCEDHDYLTCDKANNCYSYVIDSPEAYWSVPGHGYVKQSAKQFYENMIGLGVPLTVEPCSALINAFAKHVGLLPTYEICLQLRNTK